MDMELAAIIAEMEAEDAIEEEIVITTETVDEEIAPIEEEEVIEDDVLAEDRPPIEENINQFFVDDTVMLKANAKYSNGSAIASSYFPAYFSVAI